MRPKILLKRALLIVALLWSISWSILFVLIIFYSPPPNLTQKLTNNTNNDSALLVENVVVLPNQEQAGVGLPVRLKIPNINVDAPVEYVGLAPDGAMDSPKERTNTAWFELGKRPGEDGSAVIAGHYGWRNNEEAVFDNLHTLRKGDRIYVEDDRGNVISFVVREIRSYGLQSDSSAVFGSPDGKSHLNLVTCGGEWNKVSQTYSKRLVVFTDKE